MKKPFWLVASALFINILGGFSADKVVVLGNSSGTHLSVDLSGGALVDFRLSEQSPNPYSWHIPVGDMPENNRNGAPFQGHFLCLGRWGAPTDGEMKAGVPHNGQAGNQSWKPSVATDSLLIIRSEAPLDGITAERIIRFDAANAVFKVTDCIQSTLSVGRPFNIVQHATIGAPFLTKATRIDSNAGAGFLQDRSYPNPHQYEYQWSQALLDTLENYVSTHLFDSDTAWITASNPENGTLLGYIWKTSDYQWLNLWQDTRNGQPYAKGLEFGTTGIGRSYQDLLATDTRFHGVNSFFYLDALEKVSKSFIGFQMKIPADYQGVKDVKLQGDRIIAIEKAVKNPRIITLHNPFASVTIAMTNPSEKERTDESFVIPKSQFQSLEAGLLPALKNAQGEWIASQADDLDGDGNWDELAFLLSFKPHETVSLSVEWVTPQYYPAFVARTNVRHGKLVAPGKIAILPTDVHDKYHFGRDAGVTYPYQTDGPAWENDKMGFRHYFDGRNVRDVFGKRTAQMVMDTVGIKADGTPGDTYHQLSAWGRDIMSGASSFGLGGIALQTKDSLIRLGIRIDRTIDNVDSTRYTRIVNGPVRSMFRLDYYGWDVGSKKIDVQETMTIWGGKYGYENVVRTSPLPKGSRLVTGIVNNFNDLPYTQERIGNFEMMTTHDHQTYDKVWILGMSLLIDRDNWGTTFEAPKSNSDITTTWCVTLKPNKDNEYRYNCYAAWELTDERFRDRAFYTDMIRNYADELSNKITPVIQ
jgi:hypothetical protein